MSNQSKTRMRAAIKENVRARKRPYRLVRRLEKSDSTRLALLDAAKQRLEQSGYESVTMEALASDTGVTRQTVHNLFGTKAQLIEALFDEIAMEGGLHRMPEVMRLHDPRLMLQEFVSLFADFWVKYRLLIRRIHGIAAIDPEFGKAVEARNRRRQMAATRIVGLLDAALGRSGDEQGRAKRTALLHALTSFEFFDALAMPGSDIKSEMLAAVEKCVLT
jgi:AcrR family transcriptional regulator